MPAVIASPEAPLSQLFLFVVLGMLIAGVFHSSTKSKSRLVTGAMALGILLGFVVEWIQLNVPNRESSFVDVGVAGIGATIGGWAGASVPAYGRDGGEAAGQEGGA